MLLACSGSDSTFWRQSLGSDQLFTPVRGTPLANPCLQLNLKIVVWIYVPFENNDQIKQNFTEYLKEAGS